MKLSVSNIGWAAEQDTQLYGQLKQLGFQGIEIAPTRIFPQQPYEKAARAHDFAQELTTQYGLEICSMQSIWYGKTQRIAESEEAYQSLLAYIGEAAHFAKAAGCRNLVFGCPRNRNLSDPAESEIVIRFLKDAAGVVEKYGVILALEANPVIYNTNFVNTTRQAIELLRKIGHPALMLNLDFGTIVENREDLEILRENVDLISHVHISEPGLKPLQRREEHEKLRAILEDNHYAHFVSLEMGNPGDWEELCTSIAYLKEVFA